MENKLSLGMQAEVPEEMYEIPLGKANVVRPGSNFTILATGRMVSESLKAAETLAGEGVDCEVIDPRTLQPFDVETVVESVKKTHRVLVAHATSCWYDKICQFATWWYILVGSYNQCLSASC